MPLFSPLSSSLTIHLFYFFRFFFLSKQCIVFVRGDWSTSCDRVIACTVQGVICVQRKRAIRSYARHKLEKRSYRKKKEKTKATTIQRDDASTHDLLLKPIITRKHIYTPFPFSGRCYMCVCVCVSRWVARTLAHVRHERENIKSARCLPCK